jgi:hypothetical protein
LDTPQDDSIAPRGTYALTDYEGLSEITLRELILFGIPKFAFIES